MYGKLFESMYEGSMYGAGLEVFAVWGYVVAHAKGSRVELNPKRLADTLGGDTSTIEKTIDFLCSPDARSRHKDYEGRRLIKEGEFQYFVPSWETYQAIRNNEERRIYNRKKQQEHRAKKAAPVESAPKLGKTTAYSPESRVALHWLNEKSGKQFRECESSLAPINARLKEPDVTIDGIKQMIARQCLLWKGDRMEEYLRPQTLFGKEKFDGYYAAKDQPIKPRDNQAIKPNPRNPVHPNANNYATAKPRLQRELEEKERLATQMASAPNQPQHQAENGNGHDLPPL